jgi:hypothetical protein
MLAFPRDAAARASATALTTSVATTFASALTAARASAVTATTLTTSVATTSVAAPLTKWTPTRGQGTERLTEASPPTGQGHGGTR